MAKTKTRNTPKNFLRVLECVTEKHADLRGIPARFRKSHRYVETPMDPIPGPIALAYSAANSKRTAGPFLISCGCVGAALSTIE